MWLRCCYTNHQPGVIAGYFIECAEEVGGFPAKVRTDCGTENVIVAALQSFVTGDSHSHVYGTSPGNQRIEGWWSFFRRNRSQYWIDIFESLVQSGEFHPNNSRETDCLRFCCMDLIQHDLREVQVQWNTHRIRPSAGARCPAGIPDELYFLAHNPDSDQLLMRDVRTLPLEVIDHVEDPRNCYDVKFAAYLQYLCTFHRWCIPHDVDSALLLYRKLLPFTNT